MSNPIMSGRDTNDTPSAGGGGNDNSWWYTNNSWVITPFLVFIAIAVICIGLHAWRVRRARQRLAAVQGDGVSSPADPEAQRQSQGGGPTGSHVYYGNSAAAPTEGRAAPTTWLRRFGNGNSAAPAAHRDEGLDEFGQPPPPYDSRKKEDERAEVELSEMARRRSGELPPEYGAVVARGGEGGAASASASSPLPRGPEPAHVAGR